MKVRVNESCIGCGACVGAGPDVYEINDDGVSSVKVAEITPDLEEQARAGMEACPVGAIEEE